MVLKANKLREHSMWYFGGNLINCQLSNKATHFVSVMFRCFVEIKIAIPSFTTF